MAFYQEIWDGPGRNYSKDDDGDPVVTRKLYVTVHNTSNDASAAGEADYAKRRTDGTGSHYYCDDVEIRQSCDTDWRVGHVGSDEGNNGGISYEITGFNSWDTNFWLGNVAWDVLAYQMARDCVTHGIEARLLTIDEMRAGNVTGFITHDMARIAWGGTTHTDPGPNFPLTYLIDLVNNNLGDDMNKHQEMVLSNAYQGVYELMNMHNPALWILDIDTQSPTYGQHIQVPNKLVAAVQQMQAQLEELTNADPVSDEQLERVLRKIIGSIAAG